MQFYCIGEGGLGVRKPVSIWCDHYWHRVDQVVDCGLRNVGPLLFNGCAKLLDIVRNWYTLSYTPIQRIPNMLNEWVCWPCKNCDVFSFQELCTDPCNMGPCIIMLQHEVMVVDEWHNNGPQDLITVSLCIQNAINKMHLSRICLSSYPANHTHTPAPDFTWAPIKRTCTSSHPHHPNLHKHQHQSTSSCSLVNRTLDSSSWSSSIFFLYYY